MCAKCWRRFALLFFYFFFELTGGVSADVSSWNCDLRGQTIRCSSYRLSDTASYRLSDTYEGFLEQKVKLALDLSKPAAACTIHQFESSGAGAIDPPHITNREMLIRYTCDIPPDLTKSRYRVEESGTERYNFNCARREFKFYASGGDKYNDGKWLHWDSQGTARPLPWRPILGAGALTKSIFDQICQ
jgi:hypothetical protein